METLEALRLEVINHRLRTIERDRSEARRLFNRISKVKNSIEDEVKTLNEERENLEQGQLIMSCAS